MRNNTQLELVIERITLGLPKQGGVRCNDIVHDKEDGMA